MSSRDPNKPEYRRILYGQEEPVFRVLSDRITDNFRSPASENALLWNTFYPRRTSLDLRLLFALKPLWGSALKPEPEPLEPYFWGVNTAGERLPGLDAVLEELDGPGQKTEVDLFLLGSRSLVAVEAKNRSALGRCSRFAKGRCPEVHPENTDEPNCRYWENPESSFQQVLDFGSRPQAGGEEPSCARWYQISRTMLTVVALARELGRIPYLWMVVSEKHWPMNQRDWSGFAEQIRDDRLWRTARVISWSSVQQIPVD